MVTQQRIRAAERQARVLELAKAGYAFREIAAKVGYTNPGAAHNAFRAALKATLRPAGAEYRKVELQRLDEMHKPLWARAQDGDLQAQAQVLRLMERRAALLGLDAPRRQELMGADGGPIELAAAVDDAREQLLARLTEVVSRRRLEGEGGPNPKPLNPQMLEGLQRASPWR